jgi:hypothetical protein
MGQMEVSVAFFLHVEIKSQPSLQLSLSQTLGFLKITDQVHLPKVTLPKILGAPCPQRCHFYFQLYQEQGHLYHFPFVNLCPVEYRWRSERQIVMVSVTGMLEPNPSESRQPIPEPDKPRFIIDSVSSHSYLCLCHLRGIPLTASFRALRQFHS